MPKNRQKGHKWPKTHKTATKMQKNWQKSQKNDQKSHLKYAPIGSPCSMPPRGPSQSPWSLQLEQAKWGEIWVAKKKLTKMDRSFCLISLATNVLEGWDIIYLIGGIHSFVWSTKNFLYDIRETRYKQIKMGYQISKCLNIGQSLCFEIWCHILLSSPDQSDSTVKSVGLGVDFVFPPSQVTN